MRYSLLLLSLMFLSCDDGDLEIETIDFDSITTIETCGGIDVTAANVLIKINGDEALIVQLPAGRLSNEVTAETTVATIPGEAQVIYRIFGENVSAAYFCDAIPPLEPSVTQEINAAAGSVRITTTLNADGTTYDHFIQLDNITFLQDDGSRITDLTINDFGTVSSNL